MHVGDTAIVELEFLIFVSYHAMPMLYLCDILHRYITNMPGCIAYILFILCMELNNLPYAFRWNQIRHQRQFGMQKVLEYFVKSARFKRVLEIGLPLSLVRTGTRI